MKIKLHYSLLGIVLLFIFSGLYIEILLFFLIIILHECGHIISLKIFKQNINTFNITLVGGILDVEYKNLNILKEVIVSLSGVAVNGLILICIRYLDNLYYQDILINYNLLLIIFNLLPIYPLDGYHFFEALLKFINDPFKEQKVLNYISFIFLTITFTLSIYLYKSVSIVIVFSFLVYHNIILQMKYTQFVLKKYVR